MIKNNKQQRKNIILIILDGFGTNNQKILGDAVEATDMKFFKYLKNKYPTTTLCAAGKDVGLPKNQIGNSEVGHLHIGAGRKILQVLTTINEEIKHETFFQNPVLKEIIYKLKTFKKNLHLIGLFSHGGVHAHLNHWLAVLEFCHRSQIKENIYLHLIADGRDTKPEVITEDIAFLKKEIKRLQVGKIVSLAGRYYAMDRDQRWERTKLAFDNLTIKSEILFKDPVTYVKNSYQKNINDEFLLPAFNEKEQENGKIKDHDVVVFLNFRPDRAIQLSTLFVNKEKADDIKVTFKKVQLYTITKYSKKLNVSGVVFPPVKIKNTLGELLSNKGYTQLRLAETEKKAHVTYFFDGGKDIIWKNCDRVTIQSKKVATYDLCPEMSAVEITDFLNSEIKKEKYDFIVVNYANPDMVGHTGNWKATVKALQVIDNCLQKIYQTLNLNKTTMIITADHGNAELMVDEEGKINKKHTINNVPLIIVTSQQLKLENKGTLADVAPTILQLLNVKKPKEMTGKNLIKNLKSC